MTNYLLNGIDNETLEKVFFSAGKDVYGGDLNKWQNISFEGDGDNYAYPTKNGTVTYGQDADNDNVFYTSFTVSPYYMETAPDLCFEFKNIKNAKDRATEMAKDLKKTTLPPIYKANKK